MARETRAVPLETVGIETRAVPLEDQVFGQEGSGAARGDGARPTVRVAADDPRELVPAELDRLSRVEMMLVQMAEENRSLKRQLQAESNSSWHSTRTPAEMPQSPASFGFGNYFSEALPSQLLNVPRADQGLPRDFPGSMPVFPMQNWALVNPQGQQLTFPRAGPQSEYVEVPLGEEAGWRVTVVK